MTARIVHTTKFDPFNCVPIDGYGISILRFGFLWVPLYINSVRAFYETKELAEKTVKALEHEGMIA